MNAGYNHLIRLPRRASSATHKATTSKCVNREASDFCCLFSVGKQTQNDALLTLISFLVNLLIFLSMKSTCVEFT